MQTSAMGQFVTIPLGAMGNPIMLALKLHYIVVRPFYPVTHCDRKRHYVRYNLRCIGVSTDVTATVG